MYTTNPNPQPNITTAPAWTPGPWEISSSTIVIATMDSRDMAIICNTLDLVGLSEIDINEARANARLIAAAPEMAEALAKMTSWAGMYAQSHGINAETGEGPLSADMQAARAILARINGEGGGV